MQTREAPSRRRALLRLPTIFGLLTFSGWNVTQNFAFLISQSPALPCHKLEHPQKALFKSCQSTILRESTLSESWLPVELIPIDKNIDGKDAWREDTEAKALELAAYLIRNQLDRKEGDRSENSTPSSLVLGKFVDLCCTLEGERTLERIFEQKIVEGLDESVILGAVACFHSLLVMGMSYGLSGTPEQFSRWTAHLKDPEDEDCSIHDFASWNVDSTRRLKYQSDRAAAVKLLAKVMRKQTPQGAFELLVSLGVWNKYENLVLLRSGFPIRFSDAEMNAAQELLNKTDPGVRDPDSLLGIRKDLRSMKVVTIDSASTSEIDDGVACEEFTSEDGSTKRRYWIHIADADRIATRDSLSFLGAKRRATSHYLPEMAIPMFPSRYVLSSRCSLGHQNI
jgi:RNB domain